MSYPRSGGFTLIELMIVIAILGILATLVLPKIAGVIAHARYGRMMSDMDNIRLAAYQYQADQNAWAPGAPDGVFPPEFAAYLSVWPTPPCPGYVYTWQNWASARSPTGRMVFISLCNIQAQTNPMNLYLEGMQDAGPDVFNAPGGHFLRCYE